PTPAPHTNYTLSLHDALPIYSTKPHEVYVMANRPGAVAMQVTTTPTEEWRSFKWIDPQLITYRTRDGVDVHAISRPICDQLRVEDRKSTRLNSSHRTISYAVF